MISLLTLLSDNTPHQTEECNEGESKSSELIDELIMLLTSRPRSRHIIHDPILEKSVMNYGIHDIFPEGMILSDKRLVLISRIEGALKLFEPRLTQVEIKVVKDKSSETVFRLEANFDKRFIRYFLKWDDAMNQFYLRE